MENLRNINFYFVSNVKNLILVETYMEFTFKRTKLKRDKKKRKYFIILLNSLKEVISFKSNRDQNLFFYSLKKKKEEQEQEKMKRTKREKVYVFLRIGNSRNINFIFVSSK